MYLTTLPTYHHFYSGSMVTGKDYVVSNPHFIKRMLDKLSEVLIEWWGNEEKLEIHSEDQPLGSPGIPFSVKCRH